MPTWLEGYGWKDLRPWRAALHAHFEARGIPRHAWDRAEAAWRRNHGFRFPGERRR